MIEIFAPRLETLKCSVKHGCSIDMFGCTALKHLELHDAILSSDYVQHLLSESFCIEELKLSGCLGVDKFQISSSCLKRLSIDDYGETSGAEIDAPNLLCLRYNSSAKCRPKYCFLSWNAPKVEEVHMVFFNNTFRCAYEGGLKWFLEKLQNYEDLKLVIGWLHDHGGADFIVHEKLQAVSFSSLNEFVKRVNPTYVIISSISDETLLTEMLGFWHGSKKLSLISSSRQSIKLLHKKLSNRGSLKIRHSEFKLVSMEEMEKGMDSACKSFVKTHSNGYHAAGIVLVEKA
ncbi:unnamed protein product [Cuscuta campestris]|uniref:At1g61320/AtMIF1 LRR domain-containing protein n=1 Tax=Cuscuta campestris TaxID=132261 RepID=A0A484KAX4_9ASTE|nr:unnamed protein product [Cuscuta campestris]